MKAVLIAFAVVIAAPAAAQSNVPPPPAAGSATAKTVSTGFGSAGTINDATGYVIQGGVVEAGRQGAGAMGSVVMLDRVGGVLAVGGVVLQAAKMGTDLYRGDTAAVIESSAGLAIDAGMEAGCGASGPAVAACTLTYAGAKIAGTGFDAAYSAVTQRSIGADTYDGVQWVRHQVDPSSDMNNPAYWAKAEADMRAQHAAAAADNLAANDEEARGHAILAEAQAKWAEIARGDPQVAVYQSEIGYGGGLGGGASFSPAVRTVSALTAPRQVAPLASHVPPAPAPPHKAPSVCGPNCHSVP